MLFAERGVGGTSLQMIADALGVTKAAVYFQFRTKEEIVLAVAEVELQRLEVALEAAEAEGSQLQARDTLLAASSTSPSSAGTGPAPSRVTP